MIGAIILQIILIFLNAIFASAELAVLSTNGTKLEKLCPLGKGGWNWGEIIFGAYEGSIFAWRLLC